MADETERKEIDARDLVARPVDHVQAIIPHSVDEVTAYVCALINTGAVPKSYADLPEGKRKGYMSVAILKGMELGMPPLLALQSIYIVNGIPTVWGDAVVRYVFKTGEVEEYREEWEGDPGKDNRAAIVHVKRKGVVGGVTRRFSVADAMAQKLLGKIKGGPWEHSRDRMLMIRARTYAFRDLFADAFNGLAIREEEEDKAISTFGTIIPPEGEVIDPLAPAPKRTQIADNASPTAGAARSDEAVTGLADSPSASNQSQGGADAASDAQQFEDAVFDDSPPQGEQIAQAPMLDVAAEDESDLPEALRTNQATAPPFWFKIRKSDGSDAKTEFGEQWAETLVGMFKRCVDKSEAQTLWNKQKPHINDAAAAGYEGLVKRIRDAADTRGVSL